MKLRLSSKATRPQTSICDSIRNRCSDRAPYSSAPLPVSSLDLLAQVWKSKHLSLHLLKDRAQIDTVADLTGQGIAMALSLPGFREELADLIRPNNSAAHTGLFGYALGYGSIRARLEPYLVRSGRGRLRQAAREEAAWRSSGAVAAILATGDTAEFWIEAGRAYARLGIKATELGLHISTSAAVVEASDFHLEVEKLCAKPASRLQIMMRIGTSARKARTSPRLSVEELFD